MEERNKNERAQKTIPTDPHTIEFQVPSKRMHERTKHRAQLNGMRINKTFWIFTIFSIDYYVLTLLHWESKTLSAPNSIKMFISSWIVFFHSHVKEFFYLSIRWGVCVSMQVYVFMQFLPVIFPFIFLLHPFYCSSFLFISRFLSHFLAFPIVVSSIPNHLMWLIQFSYLQFYYLIREFENRNHLMARPHFSMREKNSDNDIHSIKMRNGVSTRMEALWETEFFQL